MTSRWQIGKGGISIARFSDLLGSFVSEFRIEADLSLTAWQIVALRPTEIPPKFLSTLIVISDIVKGTGPPHSVD